MPRMSRSVGFPGGEWFVGAALGIFVHWDHASQQGLEISWPLVNVDIAPGTGRDHRPEWRAVSIGEYQSSAATFNPTEWDAAAFAALAKQSGATYAIFTARHHAGYSMFHTAYSEFSVAESPFEGDLTSSFTNAVRDVGLKVGLYFSLPDWNHPDYPAIEARDLPYKKERWPEAAQAEFAHSPFSLDKRRRSSEEAWSRYLHYIRGQLTELLTNYGEIDLLWFDGDWERSPDEWRTAELRDLVKSLQPDIVINDRLTGAGDYATPEQGFPSDPPLGPWELCLTMNRDWAWNPADNEVKSTRTLLRNLIEVVSRGGNLLLNIGPKGDGSLNPAQVDRLVAIGDWMETHRESVVGVEPTAGIDFYGPTTARPNTLYLHLVSLPVDEVIVRGVFVNRVSAVRLLADPTRTLIYEAVADLHARVANELDQVGELRIVAPQPSGASIDVIAIDFSLEAGPNP